VKIFLLKRGKNDFDRNHRLVKSSHKVEEIYDSFEHLKNDLQLKFSPFIMGVTLKSAIKKDGKQSM